MRNKIAITNHLTAKDGPAIVVLAPLRLRSGPPIRAKIQVADGPRSQIWGRRSIYPSRAHHIACRLMTMKIPIRAEVDEDDIILHWPRPVTDGDAVATLTRGHTMIDQKHHHHRILDSRSYETWQVSDLMTSPENPIPQEAISSLPTIYHMISSKAKAKSTGPGSAKRMSYQDTLQPLGRIISPSLSASVPYRLC